ncbi:hypothetical protein BGZ90_009729 [Linnemannia elongata]|nr:hypothetical protein BGZ90_009729 [Linnemannia elongata]
MLPRLIGSTRRYGWATIEDGEMLVEQGGMETQIRNFIFTPILWESITFVNTAEILEGFGWMKGLLKMQWFHLFERSALESGALEKNGRWIRKVDAEYCGMVDLLTRTTNGGSGEVCCEEVVVLEIGDGNRYGIFDNLEEEIPTPQLHDVHAASVVRLLQHKRAQLRKLTFSETLLSTDLEDSARMIRASEGSSLLTFEAIS